MAVKLMRTALRDPYRRTDSAHLGLLIQRGLDEYDDQDKTAKSEHIGRICDILVGDFYRHAYERWQRATTNELRFRSVILALETRLFIGLTGGGMLETGCAIGHSHGMPYIPGSSTKGVVQTHVRNTLFGGRYRNACNELFGAEPNDDNPLGLSGLVSFHDAWWVPGSGSPPHANRPLVQEVVTTHHPDYYQHEGRQDATDLDSPIPNAQIAVRGSFLFVLEGPPAWTDLAEQMLIAALGKRGIGAKTRSGYGFLQPDDKENARLLDMRNKIRKERVERERTERKRREEERKKREFEALSEERKLLFLACEKVMVFLVLDEYQKRQQHEGINAELNRVVRAAQGWPNEQDRNAAADLLEGTYDKIGWTDPGKNKEQKEKQKKKRKENIAEIRQGSIV